MRSIRRSLLFCLAAAAAAASVAVVAQASDPAGTPVGGAPGVKVPTLHWTGCGGGFECATAAVPRDYARPAGPTFRIALLRRPARDPEHRIGSLFVNPGGPGASGVDYLRGHARGLGALNRRFDLVSWDPRGVGASRPLIRCATAAEQRQVSDPRTLASNCVTRNRGVLGYLSTGNVARDLDVLRAAVGDERLSYLGYSYGTAIGMTYASLFGDRQRAMVLDGAVDATWFRDPLASDRRQAAGRELALGRFLDACRAHQSRCRFGGGDPRRALDGLVGHLNRRPLRYRGLRITGGLAQALVGKLLYTPTTWPVLADALTRAQHRDGSGLGKVATGLLTDGSSDAYLAFRANDGAWPANPSVYRQEAVRTARTSPHFGAEYTDGQELFALLKPRPNGRFAGPFRTPAGAATTLVIGTTFDPATPYAEAKSLTATLGNARLLTLDGDGHGASYHGNGECIDHAVTAYLVDQRLPAANTVCRQPARAFAARQLA